MWIKKGLVLNIESIKNEEIKSHGSIPFALNLKDDDFLIFFSSRDSKGRSFPYAVNATIKDGEITIDSSTNRKILELGHLGTFDDSGIMPSSVVWNGSDIYLYYIGWNPQVTVSYRLSIGLAISKDNGITFERKSLGPILDRDIDEPFFNTAPFVMKINDHWKMWYISCTEWNMINNRPEPKYLIKSACSPDGITWTRDNQICINYDEFAEAIGRPCVLKNNDMYELFFSYRKVTDYRNTKGQGYKIGKATSNNLVDWNKQYEQVGIDLSESGWDSQMMEYCHVFNHKGMDYMLYNGNGFGYDGFGYAIRK